MTPKINNYFRDIIFQITVVNGHFVTVTNLELLYVIRPRCFFKDNVIYEMFRDLMNFAICYGFCVVCGLLPRQAS